LAAASGRTISAVEAARIWPKGIKFIHGNPAEQDAEPWLQSVRSSLEGYDLVFLDPDTGLKETRTREHCAYDDLQAFWKPERALIIYQADAFRLNHVATVAERIKQALGLENPPRPLRYRNRTFFVVLPERPENEVRRKLLAERLQAITEKSDWATHFRLVHGSA
jgi:hypothetical protein